MIVASGPSRRVVKRATAEVLVVTALLLLPVLFLFVSVSSTIETDQFSLSPSCMIEVLSRVYAVGYAISGTDHGGRRHGNLVFF